MTNLISKRHINLLNKEQILLLIDIIDSQLHKLDVEENTCGTEFSSLDLYEDLCFIRNICRKTITTHYPCVCPDDTGDLTTKIT